MMYLMTVSAEASTDIRRALIRNDVFTVNIYNVDDLSGDCELLFIDARHDREFGMETTDAAKDAFSELPIVVFTSRNDGGGSEKFRFFERADTEILADDIDYAAYEASTLIYDFDYDTTTIPRKNYTLKNSKYHGHDLALNELESSILAYLLYNRNRFTPSEELENICLPDGDRGKSTIRSAIHRINKRTSEISGKQIIHSVRGKGYYPDDEI